MADQQRTRGRSGQRDNGGRVGPVVVPGTGRPAVEHDGHGQSVASWSAVIIIIVGSLVMAFGVALATVWLFVVGVVVVVVGALAGKVLAALGFGAAPRDGH